MRDGKKFFPLSYIDLQQGKKRAEVVTPEKGLGWPKAQRERTP